MVSLENLEKRIRTIEVRNERVELDKSWEESFTRKILLFLFTYLIVGFYFRVISLPEPWLNAFVPALAFVLSTLSLNYFKNLWLKGKMINSEKRG